MNKFIFATDPHGNICAYEKLFEIAEKQGLNIILGGDLTPKQLAIKLKDYKLDENSTRERPGEVLPLSLIEQEKPNNTYIQALQKIKRLNKKNNPRKIAKELQRQGYIIHKCENAFYELDSMLEENQVIDQLCDFFRLDSGKRLLSPLKFSKEQKIYLEHIVTYLRDIEEKQTETAKKSFKKKWNAYVKGPLSMLTGKKIQNDYPFSKLAVSTTLLNYLKLGDKLEEVQKQKDQLLKSLDTTDPEVKKYYIKSIEEPLLDLQISNSMINICDSHLFEKLANYSSIKTLAHEATKPEVYIEGQKKFVNEYLKRRLTRFKRRKQKLEMFTILGNDDMREVQDDMRALHAQGLIKYLNNNIIRIDSHLFLAGYPYVKDSQGQYYDAWEKTEEEIYTDLENLASQRDPKRTIYIMHSPPINTNLDFSSEGEHIGSLAVREFIEKHQPLLTLHGHIHESPVHSKQFSEKIGETLCINPGSINNYVDRDFRAVIFDPFRLDEIKYTLDQK